MRAIAKTQTKCGQILLALLMVMMGFVLNMTPAQADGKKPGVPTVMSPPAKKAPPSKASPPKKVVPPVVTATPTKTCKWVLIGATTTASQVIEIHGQILNSCLGPWFSPGQGAIIPGGQTTTYARVCE
ncbi:hypothetical protein A3I99_02200 [Candidatus Kaiserbacteria bacterium RIFCSPLOWO2_02_FULL_45_11b]|uniref:Uncharacterized protein n=1 Tax=Candidatus Kaiserbacteria bacterium RIFCSPLOWO2_12_FULL_45_26 TaxID=1798525 RepID=A0A1F6FHN3_9BACT|nr:MAG: hypothetical protein A2929_03945 [Candidatus Kaiserbacteria bacterium RIFCSPLOWO2_01_FULL_45_25]OGG81874.1 MAG: hypothetical protein A3I99_02200 [Candidatus Kaiserbacteria bacterium RIFCSPLOWO2_02_FULL_45_11b]OGG85378.1 MAG: hypothetical protein A3G90_05005 [Candidatus Kaiserbacteria bacterium RIFCSPLOWO2_12_FULL_45_26]